jgi:hypothetical protein
MMHLHRERTLHSWAFSLGLLHRLACLYCGRRVANEYTAVEECGPPIREHLVTRDQHWEAQAHASTFLSLVQSLAKSASAFSLKKIVSTDHLGHFCLCSVVLWHVQ